MKAEILFRKRAAFTKEGLPWLRGDFEHPYKAKRNSLEAARVSALIIRALVYAASGHVLDACSDQHKNVALNVKSASNSGSAWVWTSLDTLEIFIPFGDQGDDKCTYHVPLLALAEALYLRKDQAADLLDAYLQFLKEFAEFGATPAIESSLCRTADELYFWLVYEDKEPKPSNVRFSGWLSRGASGTPFLTSVETVRLFSDPEALAAHLTGVEHPEVAKPEGPDEFGFYGPQGKQLVDALTHQEYCLLPGPTGTGKTFLTQQVASSLEYQLVLVEGMEGLQDLDFQGALLPNQDGNRTWVDGPITEAIRLAAFDKVMLFIDEINRVHPRYLNILLGLMNPKSGDTLRSMGLPVEDDRMYLTMRLPLINQTVYAPMENLSIVAAGNFGKNYNAYEIGLAVRRRFHTVIDFTYPPSKVETQLLVDRTGLPATVAVKMVHLANETRRLYSSGELPGLLDTDSLINWGIKVKRNLHYDSTSMMEMLNITAGDQICGRDVMGNTNQGSLIGLFDALEVKNPTPEMAMAEETF